MKQVMEKPQATPSEPGQAQPLRQHVVDKQSLGADGQVLRDGDGKIAERTLCGEPWDAFGRPTGGDWCEGCVSVLRQRGHEHLLPFIGRRP